MPPSPSPSLLEAKRMMEMKVAIIEDNPHRFKVSPLREVPPGQRNTSSPSMNFSRPFPGSRLQPPSLYQLAPSRSASIYSLASFNSVNSENGSVQAPEPLSPLNVTSFSLREANTLDENSRSGLGLSNLVPSRSTSAGSLAPAANITIPEDISRSFSTSSSLSSQRSWISISPGPDLTYAASDDSSGPSLHTPATTSVTPSQSSESFRKAKSMHVLASLSTLESPLKLDPKPIPQSTSLCHLKAKTVSLSTGEKGETHRLKRHAIYGPGDHHMQISLSFKDWDSYAVSTPPAVSELNSDSSSTFLEPSPSVLAAERKRASSRVQSKKAPGALLSALPSSSCILDLVDRNIPASSFLSVPPIPITENLIVYQPAAHAPIVPLKIVCNRSKSAVTSSPSCDILCHHPIIEELLQDLDAAISEWRIVSPLISRV